MKALVSELVHSHQQQLGGLGIKSTHIRRFSFLCIKQLSCLRSASKVCIKSMWIIVLQLHLPQWWESRSTVWLCCWEAIAEIKNSKGKRDKSCVSVCMSVNTITRLTGQSPPLWLAIASGHWVHLPNLECNTVARKMACSVPKDMH